MPSQSPFRPRDTVVRTARQRLAFSAATAVGLVCIAAAVCASGVNAAPSIDSTTRLLADAPESYAGEGSGLLAEVYGKKHKHGGGSNGNGSVAEQWSSIMGWVSIASWVIVYSPQLHENYVLKSADGLSITFVYIWLAGDALNGLGALRQGLLWTMIILALYYVLCDIALIAQYYYYRRYYKNGIPISSPVLSASTERTPLLNGSADEQEDVPPVAAAAAAHAAAIEDDSPASWKTELVRYFLALLLVFLTGVLAWYFSSADGDSGRDQEPPSGEKGGWKWDAQIFGWASALLYLSSRVPQIAKNRQTKCEGLSVALFLFAVMGNVTYVASIAIKSQEAEYLLENLSWLVGSLGTIFLDFIVLSQFIYYASERSRRRQALKASGRRRAESFSAQD